MQRLHKRGARTVRPITARPQLDRLEDRVYPGDVLQLLGWTALGTSLPPLFDPDPWASPFAVMSGTRAPGTSTAEQTAPVPADAPESGTLGVGSAGRPRPGELTASALLSRLLTAGGDGSAAADSSGHRLEWSGPNLNWDWLGDPFADLFRTERDPAARRRPAPAGTQEVGRPDLGDGGAVGGLAPRALPATPPTTSDGIPTSGADPLLLAVQGDAFLFNAGGETAPRPPVPPPEPPPGDQPLPRLDANSIRHNYARLPLAFEPNRGQAEAGVNFLARAPGYGIALTPTEAALVLSKRLDGSAARPRAGLRMQLVGANPAATPQGMEQLPGRSNYFLGNDPRRWVTNLPQYAQVRYQDVYPGIHALYYGTSRRQLEFDFVVTPGADPGRIQLAFPATPNLRLDARGDLVLPGPGGDVLARAPVAYQLAGGTRQAVSVRYDIGAGRRVGFQLGAYDPGRELYIDPVIHYSTYLGGEGDDSGADIAVDTAGNAHVVGTVSSNEVFTASGGAEVFVSKLDPTGTKVLYTDYFGGSGHDEGVALALDMAGSAYITGTTSSADFITTSGAFQRTLKGGEDLFIVKLNAAGSLVYATLLGGSTGADGAGDLAVDGAGQVHVTGHTSSWDFPVTLATAWFPTARGGFDAFVTRLNATGTALGYGTYLGGTGNDYGTSIAVDSQGRAVVTGRTGSTNFPTVGALQSSKAGGDDVFITQLNAAGSAGVFSTYLGGSGDDEAHDLALDPQGNSYLTGITHSNNFPTVNAFQATRPSPNDDDGFVTKVLAGGSAWGFSTYLGGNGADRPYGLAVDYTGSSYITGWTTSSNYPTLNPVTTGQDLFITQLEPSGSALAFSTTFGGSGTDEGRALAVDPLRNVYATGWTQSQDFPTTPSFQGWGGGNTDAFVLKLDPLPTVPVFTVIETDSGISTEDQITSNQNLTLKGTAPASSTVTLTRVGVGVIGTATANSSGDWTFNYTATTLPEAIHAFTATTTQNGKTSRPTAPFLVTVDRTAPVVALDVPATTYDRSPLVRVTSSDFHGLDGTWTTSALYLDVDLNNDGDFTDTNETAFVQGGHGGGYVERELVRAGGIILNVGTARVRARVQDKAGNWATGATYTITVQAQPSPWVLTATQLSNDPRAGLPLLHTGTLQLEHRVDLDRSPGAGQVQGQARVSDPYASPAQPAVDPVGGAGTWRNVRLVYNADRDAPRVYFLATIPSDTTQALPGSISYRLNWNGGTGSWTTTSAGGLESGDTIQVGLSRAEATLPTGRYPWTIDVKMNYATPIERSVSGVAFLVREEASPFGRGWTLSLVDRLVNIAASGPHPAGQLRVYGTGGWDFYQDLGGGSFLSPAGNPGTLVRNGDNTFTYTSPTGDKVHFDTAGKQTSAVRADGAETVGFTFDGSNRVRTVTTPDGAVSTFSYGGAGRLELIQTTTNRRVTVTHDEDGRLTEIQDPDQRRTTYGYDGKPISETVGARTRGFSYRSGTDTVETWVEGEGETATTMTLFPAVELQGLSGGPLKAFVTDGLGNLTSWELDERGRPLRRVAPGGGASTWTRNASSWVTSFTDPLQRITTYTRDAQGYVTLEQRPDGSSRSFAYQTAFHALTTFVNERGHLATFAYDPQGHRVSMRDTGGGLTTYAWSQGLLVGVTDPLNRLVTFQHDAVTRRLTKEIHALGEVSYSYDSNGNLAARRDALGQLVTTSYDPMGRLLLQRNALQTWTYSYTDAGQLYEETDPLGRKRRHAYDNRGLETEVREAVGTPLERLAQAGYDSAGRPAQVTDPLARQTQFLYDGASRPTQVIDALGQRGRAVYDRAGNLIAQVDEFGNISRVLYDALNRPTQVIDALGNITTTVFDPAGNVVGTIDALQRRTSYVFDALNRQTQKVEAVGTPLQRTTTTEYDPVGNTTAVVDPLLRRVEYRYDALDRQTQLIEAVGTPLQRTTTSVFDAVGNLTGTIDPLQIRTSYIYDGADRRTQVIEAVGTPFQRTATTEYDLANNTTAEVDPMARRTEYRFDELNRQTQVIRAVGTAMQRTTTLVLDLVDNWKTTIDPLFNTTHTGHDARNRAVVRIDGRGYPTLTVFDAADNPIAVADASGNLTSFAYDPLQRMTAETTAFGTRSHGYDLVGNRTSTTDRNGRLRQFQFDALNRRTAEVWFSGGNPVRTMTYGYNLKDELTSASDPDSAYAQAFDALGRATSVSNSGTPGVPTVVLTPGYDAASRPTSLSATVNGANDFLTTFQHDPLGRRTSTQQSGTGVAPKRIDVTYNAASQLDTITRYGDLAGTQLVATSTYAYCSCSRLTGMTHSRAGTPLAQYSFTYDLADRLTQFTGPDGTSTYAYDPANQLTAGSHSYQANEGYAYDGTGNRTNSGYQTGGHNRLLSDGTYGYQYDSEGNRTRRTTLATGDYVEYEWDHRNRLTRVVFKTSGGTVTKDVTYGYDLHNRRLRKTVDPDGPGSQLAEVKRFVYDGHHIALVFNGAGSLTNRYLHGAAIDQVFADEQLNPSQPGQPGTMLWPLADHQGTVRDLVNSAGVIQKHRKYDSFGRITSDSNAALDHLFAYTGREWDAESGQHYYRARYYDQATGRLLSEDPTGFTAGDSNLYRYVRNQPTYATDPHGTDDPAGTGSLLVGAIGGSCHDSIEFDTFSWLEDNGPDPAQLQDKKLPKSADLTWEHYRKLDPPQEYDAVTGYRLENSYKRQFTVTRLSKTCDQWTAIVEARATMPRFWVEFNPATSYVVKGQDTPELLEHERLHLRMAEYIAEKALANLDPQLVGRGIAVNADQQKAVDEAGTIASDELHEKWTAYVRRWAGIDGAVHKDHDDITKHGQLPMSQKEYADNWRDVVHFILGTEGWIK
jgi:RHS repeat-associated protein